MAMEALVAGAMAMAVDVAAYADWAGAVAMEVMGLALALETSDTASAIRRTMEDMDSPNSTKIPL